MEKINSTVETKNKGNISLAFTALDDCNTYIDTIIYKSNLTCKLYSENKRQEAETIFIEIIELMDLYIQLITNVHKVLKKKYPKEIRGNKSLANLEIHLLSIFKAILPAKEKNDIIMLCDLLEYELVDNLTQWKIQAIPELKALKNLRP